MGRTTARTCALLALLGLLAGAPRAGTAAPPAPGSDYLSTDLRARVERLKADVARQPTAPANQAERARTLWDWANARALAGGFLPVNLTQAVAAVLAEPDLASPRAQELDRYVFELALHDEQPDAIGTLRADPGPFVAGSYVTIRQTYTVGARSLQTGGGFLVARHFMPNYGLWQVADPGADNHLSIASSNSRVRFVATTAPISGMHGEFRGVGEALVFRIAAGTLEPGDTVTITYGDTRRGSRGFLMADFSSDAMPLPLYLSFDESEPFVTLPIQPIAVSGAELARVHAFAPSVVAAGEPFALAVRAEDRYWNRSSNGHRGWRLTLNGAPFKDLPPGSDAITLLEGIRLADPGVYRFGVESPDGAIRGESNPVLVEAEPARRIYWGDTHGHSGFAEGIGTPEGFMRWARDDARLDFVTHSEHDVWLDDAEWDVLRDNVSTFTREGSFIAYLGYEWTIPNLRGGHHNVLFRTAAGRDRVPAQFFSTLSRLYAGLRASAQPRDVVVIPHAHQAGDYRQSDPELEPLVEILSQHGNFEWFGRMYLNHGHQVGFTAASDNHLSQPGHSAPRNGSLAQRGGLGAVLAPEKTTDALFDAMKSLSAYATTGDRIILDVSVNGTGMGQRAPFALERKIRGRVIGTAPIESVTLIRNDAEVWQQDYLTDAAASLAEQETLQITFASDSDPFHPGDNPRGWRHWRGTLAIEGAALVAAEGTDFHNLALQRLEVDPNAPNRLRFATLTRGDQSSIRLALGSVRRTAMLRLTLDESRETGGAPPLYRPPARIDGASLDLELRAMSRGSLRESLVVDGYRDSVTVRRLIEDGPREVEFEFDDLGEREGDYYFVRVRQADDAMAWSSPIWVGGYPPR